MNDAERLAREVQEAWRPVDAAARVEAELRDDGKVDVAVVSQLFEGRDSSEREALFWPAVRELPREDLVHMTYALLLTPEEAARYYADRAAQARKERD